MSQERFRLVVLSSRSFSRYLINVCIADNAVLACWFMSCPLASPNTLKSQLESAASPQNLDMENHGAFNMAHIAALKMVLLNSPVTLLPRCSTDHLLRHERCCFQQGLYLSEVQLTQTHSGITVFWVVFQCPVTGMRQQGGTNEHICIHM